MKRLNNYIIVVLLSVSSLLLSCGTGEEPSMSFKRRVIKNISSYQVEFIVNTSDQAISEVISPSDSILFEGECFTGAGIDYCLVGWSGDDPLLSCSIFFDQLKVLVFEADPVCTEGRNPLGVFSAFDICGYSEIRNTYFFEITDEDYDNAIPINED